MKFMEPGKMMKNFVSSFTLMIFRDKFFKIVVGLSLLINLAIWIFLYVKISPLGNTSSILPLHYNVYFGIDFIGDWKMVFMLPTAGIIFIMINFILADVVYLKDKVIGYFLAGAGLFSQIILAMAAFTVVMLNR